MTDEPEDIDKFLYGDEADYMQQSKESAPEYQEISQDVPDPDAEPEELVHEKSSSTPSETDDDEEDELEIVIQADSAEPTKRGLTQVSIDANKASVTGVAGGNASQNKPTIDINAPGQLNGQNIFDVDLDTFEEKPWNKPGADITDFFNYGFTEITWRQYCAKQKQVRDEYGGHKKIAVFDGGAAASMMPPLPPIPLSGQPGNIPPFPFPGGQGPPAGFPFPPFMFPPPVPKASSEAKADDRSKDEEKEREKTREKEKNKERDREREKDRYESSSSTRRTSRRDHRDYRRSPSRSRSRDTKRRR